jgi:hypothetical protein
MNYKTFCTGVLMTAAFFSQSLQAAQEAMTFKNERGSVLEVNLLDDNKIEGYFTTAVASKSCPQAVSKKRPIIGYQVGNAISFSVVYPMCNSIMTVSGNFTSNKTGIDTIAILNHQAKDITHEGPGARFIGHDLYKKE